MAEKILVIDDEPLILTAVERALARVGYTVIKAQNTGEIEVALAQSPFDLLITDVYMHEESSDTIIERVKEQSPSVRVIKMSGASNRDGSVHFIEKPFSINELRSLVKDVLDEPS